MRVGGNVSNVEIHVVKFNLTALAITCALVPRSGQVRRLNTSSLDVVVMGSLRVCIQRGVAFTNPLVEGLGCQEFEIDRTPMSTKVNHGENGEDEADEIIVLEVVAGEELLHEALGLLPDLLLAVLVARDRAAQRLQPHMIGG